MEAPVLAAIRWSLLGQETTLPRTELQRRSSVAESYYTYYVMLDEEWKWTSRQQNLVILISKLGLNLHHGNTLFNFIFH